MKYYEIAIASRSYQGKELLTYASDNRLKNGTIVLVKLRKSIERGFVVRAVSKPGFATKPIDFAYDHLWLPAQQIELFKWLLQYYPSGVGQTANLFIPNLIKKNEKEDQNNDVINATIVEDSTIPTSAQASIIKAILEAKNQTHILHGDTGTGKTFVYKQLVNTNKIKGKSSIILTPEIGLTPQMAEQFRRNFQDVFVVHSGLTEAQKRTIWLQIFNSERPVILIGPRSALFYPVKNIGFIVADEFHESAYKQQQNPRYNALRAAGKLASLCGAKLVLGSATPPVEDYFYALQSGASVHRLTEKPATTKARVSYQIIDLSDKSEATNTPLLSKTLLTKIEDQLNSGHQVLLFLNKRGSSRLILCNTCGWKAVCERCNIPYTYHSDFSKLVCHTCGKQSKVPINCQACGSPDIFFKSPGTKLIAEVLTKMFPKAKIGRYDKDNKKADNFSSNQADIVAGKIDILVGTQLLTKGHDLPRLGLVCILLADSSLNFPDYKTDEKTYQLLHQTAGRVGRSNIDGEVIIQTYSPKADFINYAKHSNNSWVHFYESELKQREKYKFPPFRHLLMIEISRKTEASAQKFISKIHEDLVARKISGIEILEPTMAFKYQQDGAFFWQILVKSTRRSLLLDVIKILPSSCTYDIDPISTI